MQRVQSTTKMVKIKFIKVYFIFSLYLSLINFWLAPSLDGGLEVFTVLFVLKLERFLIVFDKNEKK